MPKVHSSRAKNLVTQSIADSFSQSFLLFLWTHVHITLSRTGKEACSVKYM